MPSWGVYLIAVLCQVVSQRCQMLKEHIHLKSDYKCRGGWSLYYIKSIVSVIELTSSRSFTFYLFPLLDNIVSRASEVEYLDLYIRHIMLQIYKDIRFYCTEEERYLGPWEAENWFRFKSHFRLILTKLTDKDNETIPDKII